MSTLVRVQMGKLWESQEKVKIYTKGADTEVVEQEPTYTEATLAHLMASYIVHVSCCEEG